MAELDAGTKDTNAELNDSRKQSNQVTEHGVTEVEVRSNHNNSVDGDETHGRCYSCCEFCKACCKPCMTEHNQLPGSPTRFDIIDFVYDCATYMLVHCCNDAVYYYVSGSVLMYIRFNVTKKILWRCKIYTMSQLNIVF